MACESIAKFYRSPRSAEIESNSLRSWRVGESAYPEISKPTATIELSLSSPEIHNSRDR
jgi:hypothetical protein